MAHQDQPSQSIADREHQELAARLAFYESPEFDSSPSASSRGVLTIAGWWLALAVLAGILTVAIWL